MANAGPIIAVTRCRTPADYLESLRRAGARPHSVDAGSGSSLAALEGADGILLTGGGDVDPRLYGEDPGAWIEPAEQGRDAFEIELVTRAIERDVPVLAICRGLQVLNVACGGTLVQHIPDQIPRALEHRVTTAPDALAHVVRVAPGSRLAAALGSPPGPTGAGEACWPVNSRHHQAVKHVAPGCVATATAEDGVMEAIERPASRFCLGVQWHPENFWRAGTFDSLFAGFVEACRNR
jgi:putative glutamine amidotransferase